MSDGTFIFSSLIGGSGILATALGMELAEQGHQVHFFSYAKPVRLDAEVVVDPGRLEEASVEGPEPGVVVAREGGDLAAPDAELDQGAEPVAGHRVGPTLAGGEPEVAEVADDVEPVTRAERVDQARQAEPPLGPIGKRLFHKARTQWISPTAVSGWSGINSL